ncbi:anillin isoform X2 [Takifugu rubripes]|uniref:Anillin n=1 Tax=Takifugu rubripes TaxID=31033 RepID=H2SQH5_TAKRU|nr:anillin isoform X2 [Takifugu rubripes]|eukprot:XP_011607550.1 PREDICTED: actin-binding protein anillin isoform X3 [Takifugu rubripes]
MDPFTEKLLERTRARRENLQKKMAERPNAANRQVAKRPLTDTNSLIGESAVDKVPQVSTKPSPNKRKCSEENVPAAAGEENQEPVMARSGAPKLSDPPTERKPPVGPASIRSASSMEKVDIQPAVQPHPEPERMVVSDASEALRSRAAETVVAEQTPSTAGMKSRLQMLAEQRKCWGAGDTSDAVPDYTPMSLLKRQAEAPPTPSHTTTTSSGTPVGRRGRLAHLAATIGSWEDDLSHSHVPAAKEVPSKTVPKAGVRDAAATSKTVSNQAAYSPLKSSRVVLPSTQKSEAPVTRPAQKSSIQGAAVSSPQKSSIQGTTFSSPQKSSIQGAAVNSPQKSSIQGTAVNSPQKSSIQGTAVNSPQKSSIQGTTFSSPQKSSIQGAAVNSPQKSSVQGTAFSSPQKADPLVPQNPLKNPVLSKAPLSTSNPQKPERAKPTTASTSQDKTPGAPGVKTFLERFGERCQERSHPNTPAGGADYAKVPSVAPSAVTPNSRLMQERFRAAQVANTTTADLTQRQKMEREAELAQIRNRFQKGNNMWKTKEVAEEANKVPDVKESDVQESASLEPEDEPTPPSTENTKAPRKCSLSGLGLMASPPASTSSPRKVVVEDQQTEGSTEQDEEVKEIEMNVDQSINSDVINGLFEGILEQSEDQGDEEEQEEEDALNISSMSLLTPLAETVAAVVKSPERRMMTSTPASSFLIKSNTPESVSSADSLQRTEILLYASSDYIDIQEEDHKLPYSVDAYRSTRLKEMERPSVKQVIVRKENVCQRAEEPKGTSVFSIRQKMKVVTSEMNLQQTVIHQASQALNCCTDEEHGKGSQVEAEAQRLLLVATARREALVVELDRLKGELTTPTRTPAAPDSANVSASKGSISLKELRLPLKADFVCSTANKPEATKHSFFIIIRAGAQNMVATPLASTHRGLSGDTLTFPTKFTLSDVSSNFEVDLEVYGLVQKREICSDKKKKPNKSKAITPKRFLAMSKSVQTPVVASPGGPNAVRTSNFVLVGSHKLTLESISKNKFSLEKVPFLCPLEGHIYLQLQCEVGSRVEQRGFLNMFEDVSGFGAWHRRWCVLSGYGISYWKYPDDEERKNPIGRVNLANCTSKQVGPVNREFCARPNTLELITVRPQREDDKETLVTQCQNTLCVTKNWLSADTKDERNLWMNKLNQILLDLRMWKPNSCFHPQ